MGRDTGLVRRLLGGLTRGALGRRGWSPAATTCDEDTLRIAAAALTRTGDDFLPAVVEAIAASVDASLVVIGELDGDSGVKAVAVSRGHRPAPDFMYELRESPAADLIGRQDACYPEGVCARFPNDPHLAAVGAQGWVGVALLDAKRTPVGVLTAATRTPIADPARATSLLMMFAGRVTAEILRAQSERELRRSEAHLLQVQRVEAVGRLAGGIAHDFNNLLMIMIGYAEILRDREGPSPELTELLGAAHRATTLTRQLLAFGRRQVLQAQRIDVNRVVTQVQTMLGPVIGAQVHLATSLDPRLPPIEADPGQVEQVLVNLALNARDAMPDGGTLLLETRVERVERPHYQMPPGTYVCLAVSDTGVGMTPEVQAHIFEPFFTTKGNSGTGLGLSSVYGIVKQSGGFIWCQSEPGRGTRFTIYFQPAQGHVQTPADAEDANVEARGTEHVLVVDDEPGVRTLLARLLRARGYHVDEAADGAAALERLRETPDAIDLVITDIVMPGISGTRLAEEIAARWPSVKVLFVSAYAQHATKPTGGASGRIPLLSKPFTPAQIAGTVRRLLDVPAVPPA